MIDFNLIEDFKEILKTMILEESNKLKSMKYENNIKSLDDVDELCLLYLNLNRRLIESKPRNILKSKELICPPGLETNLKELEEKIQKGDDLTPFLSRQLKKLEFPDATLNEWGIYHLHLGGFKAPDEFSIGLNEILFAMFDDKAGYFIQIMTHRDWTNKNLITIIHNNWPGLLDRFKIGVNNYNEISDSDRSKWRKGGVNTPLIMDDGTTYLCPGGGMVITQYNVLDKNYCNIIIKKLIQVEKDIINMDTIIKTKIKAIYNISQELLKFKLEEIILDKRNLKFRIRELNSGLGIEFKGEDIIFYKF